MSDLATRLAAQIATEIAARPAQVQSAVDLLDGGATVPFIARYRKEITGGLDDTQLRMLAERLTYLRELESRRAAILKSVDEQGKLDPALNAALSSRNGAPRPRSPANSVSRRWRKPSSPIAWPIRPNWRNASLPPKSPGSRKHSTARATSSSKA
jgi:hypothetical protein